MLKVTSKVRSNNNVIGSKFVLKLSKIGFSLKNTLSGHFTKKYIETLKNFYIQH